MGGTQSRGGVGRGAHVAGRITVGTVIITEEAGFEPEVERSVSAATPLRDLFRMSTARLKSRALLPNIANNMIPQLLLRLRRFPKFRVLLDEQCTRATKLVDNH